MSYANRLIHDLTIVRTTFDDSEGARDSRGQPAKTTQEIDVRGLIQPKPLPVEGEISDTRSAGSEIADHVIFLEPMALYGSDAILDSFGKRFNIIKIRSFDFGRTPHLEVDARSVTPTPTVVGS